MGLMLLDRAVLDMQAAGASPAVLNFVNRPQNLVSTPMDKPQPLINATRIQVFTSYAAGWSTSPAPGSICRDRGPRTANGSSSSSGRGS
jgi:hypothetical protein